MIDIKNCLHSQPEFKSALLKTPSQLRELSIVDYYEPEEWQNLMEILETCGKFVEVLCISSCSFKFEPDVLNLLRLMPNIKELNCENLHMDEFGDEEVDDEKIPEKTQKFDNFDLNFPHLATVKLSFGGDVHKVMQEALKNCTTLKIFDIVCYFFRPGCDYSSVILQQKHLEELSISSYEYGLIEASFKPVDENFIQKVHQFNLKKLSVSGEVNLDETFFNLLKSQGKSVKELKLDFQNMDFQYFQAILDEFKVLEKLEIQIEYLTTDETLAQLQNRRLETVKHLLLHSADDVTNFRTIINLFPNIQSLYLDHCDSFSLGGILDNFKKLTDMKVRNFNGLTFWDVKLASLKVLEIEMMSVGMVDSMWDRMMRNCPNLERLTLGELGILYLIDTIRAEYSRIFESLKVLGQLKYFKIDGCASGRDEHYRSYRNMKVEIEGAEKVIRVDQEVADSLKDQLELLKGIFEGFEVVVM